LKPKVTLSAVFAVVFLSHPLFAQVAHHIAAANIVVVQNDTSNNTTSVSVSTSLSINDFRIRSGSSRADYNVQIGPSSTDDITTGILIGSIDQNRRDNGELNTFPGMNYGTCGIDSSPSTDPGASGEWWLPVFQAPQNAEYNFNVAAAWFPYSDNWYGGWLHNATGVNGGANNRLIGHPSLVLGTHVIDQGSGKTKVDLRSFGLAGSNAVLLAVGGKNEANFALSSTNSDGSWTVTCHDDNGSTEQDHVGFVCVPLTNHTVVSGKFLGDETILLQSQAYNVTHPGNGTYHLSIPGVNPNNGVLLISAETGGPINGDNIVSYELNGDGWDIQTRDITAGFTPSLQNLDESNAVVSFVYIPGPTPGTVSLKWGGSPGTNWDFTTNQNWRTGVANTPTNYADATVVTLDDSAFSYTLNVVTSVAPYQVTFDHTLHNYILTGNGGISGATGLTKQGLGRLTMGTANSYRGDTTISQGTFGIGSSSAIPSGPGFGKTIVNGTLDVGAFDCTVNNLSGSGIVDDLTAGGTPHLRVYQTTNTGFSGAIKNSSGAFALTIDGSGTLTLSAANTYTGGTIVSNGTLLVNGSLGNSAVSVLPGATLGGVGTINGQVTMAPNSALRCTANQALSTGPILLNGTVAVNIPTGVSMTQAATYTLLNHGALSGAGSFKLITPVGLVANGFKAALQDTGTQLKLAVTAVGGLTGTLADLRHVVLFMNENRAFDHYFGTLKGVRGFSDRNALRFTNGNNVFFQPTGSTYDLPFHNSQQCLTDLNHSWPVTHATVNEGWTDQWIPNKTPETMCYFDRSDLPFYYSLSENFTICDEYHCSVLSSTDPNRFTYMTGTIDPHGYGGGPEIDNSSLDTGYTWKTYPEFLQTAGISWKIYSVTGDNSENVVTRFAAYKNALPGNPLYDKARVGYPSLTAMISAFKTDVLNNNLPTVTWLVGTGSHSEHPPNSPNSGQWEVKQYVDALASNPQVYASSAFIYNYDENDGFYDHAMPILPPPGTPDEYVGALPIGLGIRVPAIIVSPWTRGGRVCSQVFDHTSTIRFLETWTGVTNSNISAWRRQVCGDMTSAFDFAHPNYDYPAMPSVSEITCPSGVTPAVPSPQSMPTQEAGTLTHMPLPYQPNASCTMTTANSTLTVAMNNTGAASVHLALYANAYITIDPVQFDIITNDALTIPLLTSGANAGKYDFSCYGPNGFQRRFAGNITNDLQKIEAFSILNPANGGLKIELDNMSASAATFTVTNGYNNTSANYNLASHSTNVINVGSETNSGFYDLTVTSSADSLFIRKFLGRVETYVPPVVSGSQLLTNGFFQFTFSGPAAQPYSILATTNLANSSSWTPVQTGTLTSDPMTYTESNILSRTARFYRLVSP